MLPLTCYDICIRLDFLLFLDKDVKLYRSHLLHLLCRGLVGDVKEVTHITVRKE